MENDQFSEFDFSETTSDSPINRREFLGIAGSGIFLFFTIGNASAFAQELPGRWPPRSLPTDFNAYIKIGDNGRVACYTGKIEMGQGVNTSLSQMLADELDVSIDVVDVVMGDTDLCPWDMGSLGSMTTRFFGLALRSAAAEARRVLMELASEHLKTHTENLATENGVVVDKTNRQHRVTYAQFAKGRKIERHLAEKPTVKKPSEFKIMSKPVLRKDAQASGCGRTCLVKNQSEI